MAGTYERRAPETRAEHYEFAAMLAEDAAALWAMSPDPEPGITEEARAEAMFMIRRALVHATLASAPTSSAARREWPGLPGAAS
jgi:hypothetical protein